MKDKLEKLRKKADKILGDDADYMVVAMNGDMCGTSLKGDAESVAQGIFATILTEDSELSLPLYSIIKRVVVGLLSSETPHALDLIDAMMAVTMMQNGLRSPKAGGDEPAKVVDMSGKEE